MLRLTKWLLNKSPQPGAKHICISKVPVTPKAFGNNFFVNQAIFYGNKSPILVEKSHSQSHKES